jgi:hypothetical protein
MAGMKLLGAVLSSPDAEELFLTAPTVFYQVPPRCPLYSGNVRVRAY